MTEFVFRPVGPRPGATRRRVVGTGLADFLAHQFPREVRQDVRTAAATNLRSLSQVRGDGLREKKDDYARVSAGQAWGLVTQLPSSAAVRSSERPAALRIVR